MVDLPDWIDRIEATGASTGLHHRIASPDCITGLHHRIASPDCIDRIASPD
jgi:hypothetical protein